MASSSSSSSPIMAIIIFVAVSFILTSSGITADHSGAFKLGREKRTHLHFFFQDLLSGPSPTAIRIVAPPSSSSPTEFGSVVMIDDALTESVELDSKVVGRAQGFYAVASQEEIALLINMNFVFTDGEFNGSSLAVVGRNPVMEKVRELPVVGGSGAFRWARGYALARTRMLNMTTRDATVEYDVYVLHH